MHKVDTTDRGVLAFSHYSFNEQRGMVWKSKGRDLDHDLCWEKSSQERGRSRRGGRDNSKSRSRSPCNGLKQASYRYFASGKCFRGNQCKFLHHDYLKRRDRDPPRNELTERPRFRADDKGALQCDDYYGSAGGPRDNICDSSADYCEEDESRKSTLCCKDFLKGKCFWKQSHRYPPFKFAGEDGESK
ncbi:hypothetical protein AgCh_008383 [Apium graveolens]